MSTPVEGDAITAGESATIRASSIAFTIITIKLSIPYSVGAWRMAVLGGFREKHEDGVTQR